jgi:hypothetical protein
VFWFCQLYLPIWSAHSSTETFLSCVPIHQQLPDGSVSLQWATRLYDHSKYEAQMFHYNVVTRVQLFEHDVDGASGHGLDHCYDCRAEIEVIRMLLAWQARRRLAVDLGVFPSWEEYAFADPDRAGSSTSSSSSSSSSTGLAAMFAGADGDDQMVEADNDEDEERRTSRSRLPTDSSSSAELLPPLTWSELWETLATASPSFAEALQRLQASQDQGQDQDQVGPQAVAAFSDKLTRACGHGKRTLAHPQPAAER